jgi:hypothetical protein
MTTEMRKLFDYMVHTTKIIEEEREINLKVNKKQNKKDKLKLNRQQLRVYKDDDTKDISEDGEESDEKEKDK